MSTKVKMNGKLISQLNKDELKKYYVGQGVSRKGLSGKEKAILFKSLENRIGSFGLIQIKIVFIKHNTINNNSNLM